MSGPTPGPSGRERLLEKAVAHFAENGVGDTSLRQIAAAIGTSHRMLSYHFGSREGLLAQVVQAVEDAQRATLDELEASPGGPAGREAAWRSWQQTTDAALRYGSLFFELTSHAMRSDDLDDPLRRENVEAWIDALEALWSRDGSMTRAEANAIARLNLAVARGLLHDLLLTGDRRAVDRAMAQFDWLVFRTPHPLPEVRALLRRRTP